MRDLLTLVEEAPVPPKLDQPEIPQMITLTESAVKKIKDLLSEENNPKLKLRVFVQGGGCSGMQYGFTMDEDQSEDDFDLEFGTVHILIDSMSSTYLESAEIDFKEDQYGASFSIKNPQAQTSCGCGSSFSPY
jgi:iron-sulfur cluster insertion protein